jgi:four helix bundle protein
MGSDKVLDAIRQRAKCDQIGCSRPRGITSCRGGTVGACDSAMGVRDFRELIAWQLSYELKCEVVAFTSTGPASKDFKYRDQIRDSASSAPSNIAEGFGRFRPGDFARFLEIARASLDETRNHLIDGRDRGYLANPLYRACRISRVQLGSRPRT